MKVLFLQPARWELREAVDYYNSQRAGLGQEFLAEVRAAIERIKEHPTAWHPLSTHTRRCRTNRFPYGIIYQVREEAILIVAIAHLHREPSYWHSRVDETE